MSALDLLIQISTGVASTALDWTMPDETAPRLVYLPLTGAHVGAAAETRLEDGRVMTVYQTAIPEVWELSLSESVDSSGKSAMWLCDRSAAATAMLRWNGEGEMPGGQRKGAHE